MYTQDKKYLKKKHFRTDDKKYESFPFYRVYNYGSLWCHYDMVHGVSNFVLKMKSGGSVCAGSHLEI